MKTNYDSRYFNNELELKHKISELDLEVDAKKIPLNKAAIVCLVVFPCCTENVPNCDQTILFVYHHILVVRELLGGC